MWLKSGLPARICVAIAPPSSATGDSIVSNFERRVSAYQVAVQGEICFDSAF
jgi:hypothetical protein